MENPNSDMPVFRFSASIGTNHYFDVKAYDGPESTFGTMFAACGGRQVTVFSVGALCADDVKVHRLFWDEDKNEALNSLTWAEDPDTGNPLVCVAGTRGVIKVFDVVDNELVVCFTGHCGPILDLAVSPTSPATIASASEDQEIRLWSLEKRFEESPCVAIFAGLNGHRFQILTLAFHPSGKYLISGGVDTAIMLWAVPDIPEEGSTSGHHIQQVADPHFWTTAVHSNFVDCVGFFGDLILSKSASENRIILWRINGFNSDECVPDASTSVPPLQHSTEELRSAFGEGWEHLLTFEVPHAEPYYMRFGVCGTTESAARLAMANKHNPGRVYFWNFDMLEQGQRGVPLRRGPKTSRPDRRGGTDSRNSSPAPQDPSEPTLDGPLKRQLPHSTSALSGEFSAFSSAWSPDGRWCAVVGSGEVKLGNVLLLGPSPAGDSPTPTGSDAGRETPEARDGATTPARDGGHGSPVSVGSADSRDPPALSKDQRSTSVTRRSRDDTDDRETPQEEERVSKRRRSSSHEEDDENEDEDEDEDEGDAEEELEE